MNNADKRVIAERINAMTPEEQRFVTRLIPSEYMADELSRRCAVAGTIINEIENVLDNVSRNPSLEEMQVTINKIKFILK